MLFIGHDRKTLYPILSAGAVSRRWHTIFVEDFENWSLPWNGTNNLITEDFEGGW